jgi:hypothetical protein
LPVQAISLVEGRVNPFARGLAQAAIERAIVVSL